MGLALSIVGPSSRDKHCFSVPYYISLVAILPRNLGTLNDSKNGLFRWYLYICKCLWALSGQRGFQKAACSLWKDLKESERIFGLEPEQRV